MKRHIPALLVSIALAPVAVHAQGMQRGPFHVLDKFDVSYGPYPKTVLDECTPNPATGQWHGPYPAIVFIHGGAWTGGDKIYHKVDCNVWASYGLVGININYRLVGSSPATWWPTQLVDAQAAIRWVRSHATALNVRPDQIYALGDSAGGQIAEYLAYDPQTVPGDLASQDAGLASQVQGVVAEFAPSLFGPRTQPGGPDPRTYPLVQAVYATTPPTMLVQGTQDTTVPPENSIDIYNLLKGFGRPVQYVSFNGPHEFVGMASADINAVYSQEIAYVMTLAKSANAMPATAVGPAMP